MITPVVLDSGSGAGTDTVVTNTISPRRRTQIFVLLSCLKADTPGDPPIRGTPSYDTMISGCGITDWFGSAATSSLASYFRFASDMGYFGNQVEDTPSSGELTMLLDHANYDRYQYVVVEMDGSYSLVGPNGTSGAGTGDCPACFTLDPFIRPEHGMVMLLNSYDPTEAHSASVTFDVSMTLLSETFSGPNNCAALSVGYRTDGDELTFGLSYAAGSCEQFVTVWELAVSNYPKTVTVL